MSYIDTLNITAADLQTKVNPTFVADGPHVSVHSTPTASAVATNTITVSGASWITDELANLQVRSASGVLRQIVSNTSNIITISGGTAGTGIDPTETFTITGWPLLWSADQFTDELGQAVGRVLSALPERYHVLLRYVEREVIVRRATSGQVTAVCAFAPISDILVEKNGAVMTTGYSISNSTVTFSPALTRDDRVVISYSHQLTSATGVARVPKLLRALALNLLAYSAWMVRLGGRVDGTLPEHIRLAYDQSVDTLNEMRKAEEPWGVDELDAITLEVETRAKVSPTYGSPVHHRG